ncbi:hypothetical protein AB0M87_04805 [Streptomyces sp. NPDC051320]|uniref:hypothetical protein n=1 Tax=Streptomyces sp. NPDC051320 TaxID=3154644 RepID=UPI00343F12B3
MSTELLGYKGTVVDTDDMRTQQAVLEGMFPLGTRVRHACGRLGTVSIDEPAHVPGAFDGKPTAWAFARIDDCPCATGGATAKCSPRACFPAMGEAMICVNWDNNRGFDKWLVWAPLSLVQAVKVTRHENRPANANGTGRGRR